MFSLKMYLANPFAEHDFRKVGFICDPKQIFRLQIYFYSLLCTCTYLCLSLWALPKHYRVHVCVFAEKTHLRCWQQPLLLRWAASPPQEYLFYTSQTLQMQENASIHPASICISLNIKRDIMIGMYSQLQHLSDSFNVCTLRTWLDASKYDDAISHMYNADWAGKYSLQSKWLLRSSQASQSLLFMERSHLSYVWHNICVYLKQKGEEMMFFFNLQDKKINKYWHDVFLKSCHANKAALLVYGNPSNIVTSLMKESAKCYE